MAQVIEFAIFGKYGWGNDLFLDQRVIFELDICGVDRTDDKRDDRKAHSRTRDIRNYADQEKLWRFERETLHLTDPAIELYTCQ